MTAVQLLPVFIFLPCIDTCDLAGFAFAGTAQCFQALMGKDEPATTGTYPSFLSKPILLLKHFLIDVRVF